MAIIDVSQAEEGMVLVADALDKRGRVLIPAGKELTAKHIHALPAWGVQRIEVEGDDIVGVEAEPWAVEAAEKELAELFSLSNTNHPAIEALLEVCTRRRSAQIQESGAPPETTTDEAPAAPAGETSVPEEPTPTQAESPTPVGAPGAEGAHR